MTVKIGTLETDITANTAGLEAAKNKAEQVYKKISASSAKAEKATIQYSKSADKAGQSTDEYSKSADKAEKASNSAGRSVGQLGIQIGQFAGQVQGGQSALLAFSQQSADILFVLGQMFPMLAGLGGAVGAVIAIGSALAGSLLPHLFKSKDAMAELEEATKRLGKVAKTVGKDDIVVLTEEVAKLAKKSEEAAKTMLIGGMDEALKAIKISAGEAKEQLENFFDSRFLADPGRTSKAIEIHWKNLNKLAKKYQVSVDDVNAMSAAVKKFNETPTDENLQSLQKTLDSVAAGGSKKIAPIANSIRELSMASGDATKKVEAMRKMLADVSTASDQSMTLGGVDIDATIKSIEQLGESEREAIRREHKEREDLILANTALTESKRSELLSKSADERDRLLLDIAAREDELEQRKIDAKQRKIDLILGLDDTARERAQSRFEEAQAWIEQEIQDEELATDLIVAARNKRESALQAIRDQEVAAEERKNQQIQQQFMQQINGMKQASAGVGQVIEAMGKNGADRFQGMISGLAQSALAIANIMQAQATAQAAADTTAITLPQKIANVAAIGSLFAGIIGSISNAKKGGGRQHGGYTSGNMYHQVNERGSPELLNVGSKQYLMPTGQNGKVTPLSKASGSTGNQINLSVINNAANTVDVRAEYVTENDLRIYVDGQINKINTSLSSGRGDTAKSLQQGFNVSRSLR